MKKQINVIDLDSTLIPYDSFNMLLKRSLREGDLYVGSFLLVRVLRLVTSTTFKSAVFLHWEKKHSYKFWLSVAKNLYNDLDQDVLDLVAGNTDDNTTNVLISASSHLYVEPLVKMLNWEGKGSYFEDGKLVNLFAENKTIWLQDNYPQNEYDYRYSISDSMSDSDLLALFEKSTLWKKRIRS